MQGIRIPIWRETKMPLHISFIGTTSIIMTILGWSFFLDLPWFLLEGHKNTLKLHGKLCILKIP